MRRLWVALALVLAAVPGWAGRVPPSIGGGLPPCDPGEVRVGSVCQAPSGLGDMLEAEWATDGKISDAKLPDGLTRDAEAAAAFAPLTAIDDTAYNATTWNGVTDKSPTQDAVRDKFESLGTASAQNVGTLTNGKYCTFVTGTGIVCNSEMTLADVDSLPGDTNDDDLIDLGILGLLGTFSGSTIPDAQTVTQALQALEAAVEAAGAPDDTAYDATSWNANTDAPTKNAIRDKIETIAPVPTGTSCVVERDSGGSAVCTTPVDLSDPNAHKVAGWDDTDGAFKYWTLGGLFSYVAASDTLSTLHTESFAVKSPVDADDFLLLKAPSALTVTALNCVAQGSTPSIAVEVQECDGDGANCAGGGISLTADGSNDADTSFTDAAIDSGDWLKVILGAPSGTVSFLSCSLSYTR
jgi:hypothetical protein